MLGTILTVGGMTWVSGAKMTYHYFALSEPNGSGYCMRIMKQDWTLTGIMEWKWGDYYCTTSYPYVCEADEDQTGKYKHYSITQKFTR